MIAGPNGAGKTSVAPGLLAQALHVLEYVNADVIAKGISGFNADAAAMPAGRIMLARLDELASLRESFAFETTGASRSFADRIASLKSSDTDFCFPTSGSTLRIYPSNAWRSAFFSADTPFPRKRSDADTCAA